MKLDQFLKARLKITLLISAISTFILAAFAGSIYYFYKEQILYEISDELKSIAFEVSKVVENPLRDFSIVKNVNIPDDTYLCVYNYDAKMVFYKHKLCEIKNFFSGFQVIGHDVVFGTSIEKNGNLYYIYVGKNLSRILASIDKLKLILIYVTFVISTIILVFSFLISKKILSPIKETVEKQERFTQNVSHDLRTPLTVISSNLYLIKQKKFQNIEKNIENIARTVEYMKSIVADLLFISQIGEKEKKPVNINELLKKQLHLLSPKIEEKNIGVIFKEEDQITIEANQADMEKLFSNLLENAIKYNCDNGEIIITIKKKQVSIKNTGKLIKKENLDKIFERFYREDEARTSEGSGLGLAIVKEIADFYKLKIKVKVEGVHNEFIIRF
ncbi:HAMP domain-containing sensor histidine kinase [Persephonella sp. IF05-L8]|uniref:ATP-binding protein n=1 Tax=Persephonella sp. IF05-L8 TaxID=1158338 RepID=UPI000495BFC9